MRPTVRGQVTIPKKIRETLGIDEDTELRMKLVRDYIQISKAQDTNNSYRKALAKARGTADMGMSTDEILALTRG